MADVEITIRLPEELVERMKAVGLNVEDELGPIAAEVLEKEISRRETASNLLEITEQLDTLPDEMKPSPEEIDAEIKAYRAEKGGKADG